jgi:hypothetical protein
MMRPSHTDAVTTAPASSGSSAYATRMKRCSLFVSKLSPKELAERGAARPTRATRRCADALATFPRRNGAGRLFRQILRISVSSCPGAL